MNERLRRDSEAIVRAAVASVLPDRAVERALRRMQFPGRVYLVAAGKAAWHPWHAPTQAAAESWPSSPEGKRWSM